MLKLTPVQEAAIQARGSSFLFGPAGSGKSTSLQNRLIHLLKAGEPASTILFLVAEPKHRQPFIDSVQQSSAGSYADLKIITFSGLAREMVTLFWPLVASGVGFAEAFDPPAFLGYDLAQLLMWRVITPMLDEGAFYGLPLRPQQIVSQLLDTLNRAALNGLTLEEAAVRQETTMLGDKESSRHLGDAAVAAKSFRRSCLNNNLLDLSLVIQVFDQHLVKEAEFQRYLRDRYDHLIVDNVEEQTPAGHKFVGEMLANSRSASIAYDKSGGYKRFLAADPRGASQLRGRCQLFFEFNESYSTNEALSHLANAAENSLMRAKLPTVKAKEAITGSAGGRYRHQMVSTMMRHLSELLNEGVRPNEIAIVTPYLDGILRHHLANMFQQSGIPYRFLRRRSSPREEPRVRCWLTWLALAHPEWGVHPVAYDVVEALSLSATEMDIARAQLVTNHLYIPEKGMLLAVDNMPEPIKERVGRELLDLVEALRQWLDKQGRGRHPIDYFLHLLFNDLLALPPFQPKPDLAAAAVCDWLVRTAGRLRVAGEPMGLLTPAHVGQAFIEGIYQGLVASNPPDLGDPPDPLGVTISTIYGFLLSGERVRYQVWLEASANGWWDIPRQPLSNAFVYTPSWPVDQPWTMENDFEIRNELLSRIVRGLVNRCSDGVILAYSDLDRRGIRQDGALWRALQAILM